MIFITAAEVCVAPCCSNTPSSRDTAMLDVLMMQAQATWLRETASHSEALGSRQAGPHSMLSSGTPQLADPSLRLGAVP